MASQSEARRRLAVLMDERRLDLKLTWQAVAERGDVSLRALAMARSGDSEIRPLTRRGIDKGLQWVEGHGVDNILDGREPVPVVSPGEEFARQMGVGADSPFVLAVAREVDRAIEVYGAEVTGAQIFGDGPVGRVESIIWDDRTSGLKGKVAAIAALRAHRAQLEVGRVGGSRPAAGLTHRLTLAGR